MAFNTQRKIRVLVAEDSVSKSHMLKNTLEALGFAVHVARNSDQIPCDVGGKYSMLFLYVTKSSVDVLKGEAAQAWLEQFRSAIAIIDPDQPDLRDQCLAVGMADVLQRPVTSDALYECICSLPGSLDSCAFSTRAISSEPIIVEAAIDLEVLV